MFVLGLARTSGSAETPICAIKGSGPSSPYAGLRVTTTGVVTGDFTATARHGFAVQTPACDADAATSDGLWVATGSLATSAPEGHRLSLTGRVVDEAGLTRLELESSVDLGPYAGSLEVVRLDAPQDPDAAAVYLRAHDGMLVALPPSRVVGATDRLGEAYVMPEAAGVSRLFRGTADGRKTGLALPAAWLALDEGDLVSDALGPLTFTSGVYEVLLRGGASPTIARAGVPVPAAPAVPAGGLSVATWNLGELFDPKDDGGKDDPVPTAAAYAAGLARRAASIARALGLPDVVAVQEAEKIEVLQDLALQPEIAAAHYQAVLVEGPDPRGLDVGLLYRSDRLSLRSAEARTAGATFERPPLVVGLERRDTGERLTFVVTHLRAPQGDAATDAALRLAQADGVRALVTELQTTEPAIPIVVLGDLNSIEDGPAVLDLTADGRLLDLDRGSGVDRPYTHVDQGVSEAVDYVLVDRTLAARVREVRPRHANVDYADPGPSGALASPRASDHDAVLAVIAP